MEHSRDATSDVEKPRCTDLKQSSQEQKGKLQRWKTDQ